MKTQPTCLTSFVVFLKDYGCSWKLNPGWRDLLARRSGSNSSRRVWINVLRPLEFVNSPSKEAIDAMVFICFARVCFDPQELPYTTHLLLARLLELIKNSQELCHLGRRPTYSKRFVWISLSSIGFPHFGVVRSRPFPGASFVTLAILCLTPFLFDVLFVDGEIFYVTIILLLECSHSEVIYIVRGFTLFGDFASQ